MGNYESPHQGNPSSMAGFLMWQALKKKFDSIRHSKFYSVFVPWYLLAALNWFSRRYANKMKFIIYCYRVMGVKEGLNIQIVLIMITVVFITEMNISKYFVLIISIS